MPRPIEALVHRDALAANLEAARSAAAGARVWAVVKADAYGHGIVNVFPALQRADGFALLDIAEAELLRELGWRGPILLLEGCFDARDLEACSRLKLWHVVHCTAQIDRLAALKTDRPHHVFLKMNSGMNRLGFAPDRYRAAWLRLDALAQVEAITHMTHLANADAPDEAAADAALAEFERVTHDLPGERSVCNSAATLRFGARLAAGGAAWVRPGIMLYGSSPDAPLHGADDWKLAPAMTLRAQLIAIQELAAGDSRRLRQQLHRRAADARRRRRLRLRRRLPAPRARQQRARHAGPRRRRAHAHRRPRVDGHDHRRPRPGAGRERRQRGRPLGPQRRRHGAVDRRCRARGGNGRLRADVRARAARAGPRRRLSGMDAPLVDESEVEISAVRAQGAGGQNVNKVSSAIHLRFDVAASSLPEPVKARLLARADRRLSDEGVIVIKAQRHRSQELNRRDALARLNELVARAAEPPVARKPTRPTFASRQRRLEGKSVRAQIKAARAKVVE